MKLEVGDIYRDKDGVGWLVNPDRIQPVAAPVDPADVPKDGRDGVDGKPGKDGVGIAGPAGIDGTGFRFRGKWKRSLAFEPNDVCTHEGQTWLAVKAVTKSEPGVSKSFVLLAAKGEDGRDGYHTSSHRVVRTETVVGGPEKISAIFDSDTVAGQVVYSSSDGHVDLAQANGRPQAYAVGIAIQDVAAGQPGEYIPVGPVTCATWSLIPGKPYFLSPAVPGGLQLESPSNAGEFVILCGISVTTNQLSLNIAYMLEHS